MDVQSHPNDHFTHEWGENQMTVKKPNHIGKGGNVRGVPFSHSPGWYKILSTTTGREMKSTDEAF